LTCQHCPTSNSMDYRDRWPLMRPLYMIINTIYYGITIVESQSSDCYIHTGFGERNNSSSTKMIRNYFNARSFAFMTFPSFYYTEGIRVFNRIIFVDENSYSFCIIKRRECHEGKRPRIEIVPFVHKKLLSDELFLSPKPVCM
jgi:hypothetical protein